MYLLLLISGVVLSVVFRLSIFNVFVGLMWVCACLGYIKTWVRVLLGKEKTNIMIDIVSVALFNLYWRFAYRCLYSEVLTLISYFQTA